MKKPDIKNGPSKQINGAQSQADGRAPAAPQQSPDGATKADGMSEQDMAASDDPDILRERVNALVTSNEDLRNRIAALSERTDEAFARLEEMNSRVSAPRSSGGDCRGLAEALLLTIKALAKLRSETGHALDPVLQNLIIESAGESEDAQG